MKPESKAHLERADICLIKARADISASAKLPLKAEDAARLAYYAAFHAAKALIFERTGAGRLKHGMVHNRSVQLTRGEPAVDAALRRFLPAAYDFKRLADYDTAIAGAITRPVAARAVGEAERFVAAVKGLIP